MSKAAIGPSAIAPAEDGWLYRGWLFLKSVGTRRFWDAFNFRDQRADYYMDLYERMQLERGTNIGDFLRRDIQRYGKKNEVGRLSEHWLERMGYVGRFAEALRGTVPEQDIAILAVAEQHDDLKNGLKSAAENLRAIDLAKKKLQAVLAISIALILMFHIYIGLNTFYVFPKLAKVLFRHGVTAKEIGPVTYRVDLVCTFIQHWWWLYFPSLIALVVGIGWALPNYTGRFRRLLDERFIIFSMYREFAGASFLAQLSSLTKRVGERVMSLREALDMVSANGNPWVKWHVEMILTRMSVSPDSKGQVFATGVVNARATYRIQDLAEYAQLSDMLGQVGDIVLKKAPEEIEKRGKKIDFLLRIGIIVPMLLIWSAQYKIQTEYKNTVAHGHSMPAGIPR
jgi:type II secretory pathway component PulF